MHHAAAQNGRRLSPRRGTASAVRRSFYGKTLAAMPDAVVHYRTELLRLIAQMGLGTGALGGHRRHVVIVGFLTMTAGALVAVQGYNQLSGRMSKR